MLRQLIIITLIIIIIIGSIIGINFLKSTTDNISNLLDSSLESIKKNEHHQALEICNEIINKWRIKKGLLSIYLRDDVLSNIDNLLKPLPALIETNSFNDFYYQILKIKSSLEDLYESELLTIENLL